MNLSGVAVRQLLAATGRRRRAPSSFTTTWISPSARSGSGEPAAPGTHKGLGSVVAEIGTTAFPRIRVGIGPLTERADAVQFVLSPFSRDERARLEDALARAEDALEMIIDGRIDQAMNAFNRKDTA